MRLLTWYDAGVILGVLASLSCRGVAEPEVPTSVLVSENWAVTLDGTWTLILSDSGSEARVRLVQTDSPLVRWTGAAVLVEGNLWTNLEGPPVRTGIPITMEVADGQLRWALFSEGGWLGGAGPLAVDRAQHIYRAQGDASLMWQGVRLPVRFDAFVGTPLPPQPVRDTVPPGTIQVASPGVVTLRMDDCAAADTMSFRILRELHLVAEVAVPTGKVGRPRFCTWDLVRSMQADGNSIEAHSRTHGGTPPTFGDFYLETVGALNDLRAQGFNPEIFIQPGNWMTGNVNFDRPDKLATPYGALLRRAYLGIEAYLYPPAAVGFPLANGHPPEQIPIKFLTPEGLSRYLHVVAAESLWTHLSWHSARVTTEELESRLAVVAALRDSGLVTVLPYRDALRARRSPAPALVSGSPLRGR